MKTGNFARNLWILLLVFANIGCDQVSKTIVRDRIEYNANIEVIQDFITLTKVENTGAFLSLGSEMPRIGYKILMIILPLIILTYVLFYLLKSNTPTDLTRMAIALMLGGGIGNLLDRMLYGSVTDFLHFDFGLFQTGIVNMADISITVGFLMMIFELLFKKPPAKFISQ